MADDAETDKQVDETNLWRAKAAARRKPVDVCGKLSILLYTLEAALEAIGGVLVSPVSWLWLREEPTVRYQQASKWVAAAGRCSCCSC